MGTDEAQPEDKRWQLAAACRWVDPDLFFPIGGESQDEAKAVCARCPVQGPCLELALWLGDACTGIWAGTNDRDRKRLRELRRACRGASPQSQRRAS